jgi:peptide/nickel transport system ATP-binding protein
MDSNAKSKFRSEVQIVFQNPKSTLNPKKSVFSTLNRPLKILTDLEKNERVERINNLLKKVGLGEEYASRYPQELSGGEIQRVSIARAYTSDPSLIILDEPLSALDVSVQADIIQMLMDVKRENQTSLVFISHDLSVVKKICDRIAVMYLGNIIEHGSTKNVFSPPHHPYTRSLLSSVPPSNPDVQRSSLTLEGEVPSARSPPSGCSFHTRCPMKIGDICEKEDPKLAQLPEVSNSQHCIACHLEKEDMMDEI